MTLQLELFMLSTRQDVISADIEGWRNLLFDQLVKGYIFVSFIAWILIYLFLPHSPDFLVERSQIGNMALISSFGLIVLVLFQNIPVMLRKSGLIMTPFVLGMLMTLEDSIPGASMLMGFASILSVLLIGNRAGIFVFLASIAVIAFPHILFVGDANESTLDWITTLVLFGAVFSILIAATGYLVDRIEESFLAVVEQKDEALSTLTLLSKSSSLFNMFVESSTDIFWTADMEMNFSYMGPAIEKLSGFSVEEAMALGLKGLVIQEDVESALKLIGQELKRDDNRDQRKVTRLDVRHVKKHGGYFDVEIVTSFIRDQSGRPLGVQGISRDVTERRRMDRAMASLLESTRHQHGDLFFEALVKNLLEILSIRFVYIGVVVDETYVQTIVACDSGEIIDNFEYELNGTPCEALSDKSLCIYPNKVRDAFPDDLMLKQLKIESFFGVSMKDAQGKAIGLMVCMDDKAMNEGTLTENLIGIYAAHAGSELLRRHSEREKDLIQQQLLQSQRLESLGKLAGGVAHDFNNLLSVIGGYVDLAEELNHQDELLSEYHLQIRGATNRAAKLTRQMLTFSRRQIMEKVPLDLNVMIRELAGLFASLLPEDILVNITLNEDLGVVEGDAGQLEQIVMNLVVNARDAMLGGGSLSIETDNVEVLEKDLEKLPASQVGKFIRLRISDTGYGISEDIADHIFEPFFTTKAEGEGTGLGLSVYFGVVKQHGGFTYMRSDPEKGTVFDTYLPRVNLPLNVKAKKKVTTNSIGSETILVVEDDSQVRVLAFEMLSAAGYRVITAENGRAGVDCYNEFQGEIALVILDVMMPVMNGHEAMNQIRKLNATVPILFTSGYSEEGIHTDFILSEDLVLLEKPYGLKELLSKTREMIDKN